MHWVAHYNDGLQVDQEQGGKYHELDRSQLAAFDVWIDSHLLIRFDLRREVDGFLWRLRTRQKSNGETERFFLVGFEGAMSAVFENGSILFFGGWNDMFHPVTKLILEEQGSGE